MRFINRRDLFTKARDLHHTLGGLTQNDMCVSQEHIDHELELIKLLTMQLEQYKIELQGSVVEEPAETTTYVALVEEGTDYV